MVGRFGALTRRPGDFMKNLETARKTGRVGRSTKRHVQTNYGHSNYQEWQEFFLSHVVVKMITNKKILTIILINSLLMDTNRLLIVSQLLANCRLTVHRQF